ncbi:MAG: transcriptional repressor [Chloroflexota bacterium]|nr:transcriptional repressor [Chloroflexota bacterium]
MRSIRKSCDELKGHALTKQRRLLLDIIHDSGEPIDAKELYRRASSKDRSISLATIYRSLRLFKELGLVDKRSLGLMHCCYEISHSIEHQYMICQCCGKIIEFESPLITELIRNLQREHNFKVTGAELCLEGYCQQCNEEADNNR